MDRSSSSGRAGQLFDGRLLQALQIGGNAIEEILRKFGPLQVYDTEGKKVMGIVP